MALLAASQQSQLHITLAVLVLGLVIGVIGHINHVNWLVLLGILMIGLDVVLFSFVFQPGAG
jgi:hypothetical protein